MDDGWNEKRRKLRKGVGLYSATPDSEVTKCNGRILLSRFTVSFFSLVIPQSHCSLP